MSNPKRIQRKRVKGWRMPENTVYVGRGSKWGNQFTVEKYGQEKAVEMFRDYIGHQNSPHDFEPEDIEQLRGKNLACWCGLDQPCHADVLLELANDTNHMCGQRMLDTGSAFQRHETPQAAVQAAYDKIVINGGKS